MQGIQARAEDADNCIATTGSEAPHNDRVLRTIRRLSDHLGPQVERDVIEARVRALYSSFATATVHDFVPILVEREIRKEFVPGPKAT